MTPEEIRACALNNATAMLSRKTNSLSPNAEERNVLKMAKAFEDYILRGSA